MMSPTPYPQVQRPVQHEVSATAQHAVQVALDRRDNGGDAGAADDE
jgi:hypothetical protein